MIYTLICGNSNIIIVFKTEKTANKYFDISVKLLLSIKLTTHALIPKPDSILVRYLRIFLNELDKVNISTWPGVSKIKYLFFPFFSISFTSHDIFFSIKLKLYNIELFGPRNKFSFISSI